MISVVLGIEHGLIIGDYIGVSGLRQAVWTLASYS